jgi:hypothetical protein
MAFASLTRHARASFVLSLGLGALAPACVQEQDFLIVERAVWFDGSDTCTLTASSSTPLTMVADVAFVTRIGMGFVITNKQSPNPGSNTGIDDSEVMLERAEVSLSFSGGAIAGGEFEVTLPSNSIAGGSSQPVLVQIPTAVTDSLRASMSPGQFESLEMQVVFVGRRNGQVGSSRLGEVETRTFTYPIEICNGCLVDCSDCELCPTPTEWVGVCGFAQDTAVRHPSCD